MNWLGRQSGLLASTEVTARPNGSRLPVSSVGSGYGPRRNPTNPNDPKPQFHAGLDQPTRGLSSDNQGLIPVPTVADGIVVEVNRDFRTMRQGGRGYGAVVVVDHGHGVQTVYGHNSAISVSPGDFVTRGQVLATSGNSGRSTGPHVHYEVRVNTRRNTIRTGRPVDPRTFDWRTLNNRGYRN